MFKLNPDGTGFTILQNFDHSTTGGYLYAGLIQGADGALYGAAYAGGSFGYGSGTVFKLNPDGSGFTVFQNFTGAFPQARLLEGADGALYGTGSWGGGGGVFKLNSDGSDFTILWSFSTLPDLSESGGYLYAGLMQGVDGALYGTAREGGSNGGGTVFKLNPDGSGFTVLKNFDWTTTWPYVSASGAFPMAGLIQGADGALYGTALLGGSSFYGTVFKLNPDGSGFTVLLNFDGYNGANPFAGLIQGADGALYGTAAGGGSSSSGTVFKLNPDGSGFTVLKNFDYSTGGGLRAGLMQGADGALYGTASFGGSSGSGTVFKLNPDGTGFTVLQHFDYATTGANPYAGLMQGTDGTLYGTAQYGGSSGFGTVFKLNPDGTGFTVLLNFDYATTGANPFAGLMQGTDGALYGTAYNGGSSGYAGTVFKLNPDGTDFIVLHNFDSSTTGSQPYAGLMQGADGALYGTASWGGSDIWGFGGTLFRLTVNDLFAADGIVWHQPLARPGMSEDTDPSAGGTLKYRFKLGSTIPIQIHAQGCSGEVTANANVIGKVEVFGDTDMNGVADGNALPIEYNGVGEPGGIMDKIDGHLKFNLDTKKLPQTTKCYLLEVTVTDTSTGESRSEMIPLQAK